MPTQLQAPGKSRVVSKRDQELKLRRDMLADMNLPQRPQVLGLEEQDVSCEALCLIEETELTDAGGCVEEGYHIPNPEIIFRIEEGKEPWVRKTELPCQRYHEGEFGLETPQREISEEASFHNEMMGGVTRDGSWCSILEELWKQADQTERDPKNQNKPSHQGAFFNKKTLNTERDCDYKYPGTVIQAKPHLVSSQKGPHKHFSVAKRLKPNLEATHQNQSSITKHLDDMVGSEFSRIITFKGSSEGGRGRESVSLEEWSLRPSLNFLTSKELRNVFQDTEAVLTRQKSSKWDMYTKLPVRNKVNEY
ncbi:hypothetical protein E5288_WYG021835 [Bos mutus]|uniref:KRAB domain-containing protein n=1 Tax=Bos mutus TaxID=72004 RepID=A0A6B0S8Z8_9CETA|nr:hypothetical protein [Bos mutus]